MFATAILRCAEFGWLFGSWLLLVNSTNKYELIIGAAMGCLGTIGIEIVRKHRLANPKPKLIWMAQGLLLPYYVVQGCAVVFWALLKYPFSSEKSILRSVPFDAGGNDGASCARRAMAEAFATMPPNFVVLRIDQAKNVMVIHQVQRSGVPLMIQNLGAKA